MRVLLEEQIAVSGIVARQYPMASATPFQAMIDVRRDHSEPVVSDIAILRHPSNAAESCALALKGLANAH
jgi:hypothetical protein